MCAIDRSDSTKKDFATRELKCGEQTTHSHTPVRRRRELRGTLQRGALVCSAWRLAMTDVSTVHVTYKARRSGVAACMGGGDAMVKKWHGCAADIGRRHRLRRPPGPRPRRATILHEGPARALPSWNGGSRGEGGTRGELGVGWGFRREQRRREGACAGTERTVNMSVVSVTLDISKSSSWLNADANCRVARGGQGEGVERGGGMRGRGRREGVGGGEGGASSVQGGSQLRRVAGQAGHARSARETCTPCPRRGTCRSSAAG